MQLLINAIADKVANKLLLKTDVINQFLNDSSKAASAALAYSLKQTTDTLNSNINKCMQYRKSVNASDNIFTLSAGIYTVAGGNTYAWGSRWVRCFNNYAG